MQFFRKNFYQQSSLLLCSLFILLTPTIFAEPGFNRSRLSLAQQTAQNIANDNIQGEDLEIRRAAVAALGKSAGTVVVMHAQTGRIYTIVNQKWAIEDGFKPCSTIKLVTGVAGFKENLIRKDGNLARGGYRLGLDKALAYSNNVFFQKVGKDLGSKKMIYYAKQLGLGEITGINADNEYAGKLPYGNENLRIYSHADDFLVTPLQLAVMVSAITNGGKVLIPRIPYTRREKVRFRGAYQANLGFQPNVFERVIPGMMGAVRYGTARRITNSQLRVAGKTGSCISRKTWVGLFASVAPIQNPKFAVVAITRGKYARGKHSAGIAEKVYRALLPKYNQRFNRNLARKTVTVKSAPKIVGEATASTNNPRISDSKRKVTTARNTLSKKPKLVRNTVITYRRKRSVKPTPKPTPKVKKQKKKKELFPTVIINGKTELTRPRIVGKQ